MTKAVSGIGAFLFCAVVLALTLGSQTVPPRVRQAQRFLARHGAAGRRTAGAWRTRRGRATPAASPSSSSSAIWEPLGPMQVSSLNYGLVTGRISSVALDPSDATGNTLLAGTTGGGVWLSQNAGTSDAANVVFTPLTDVVFPVPDCSDKSITEAEDASISIGAITIQPGDTGVILAGTGDPNDALDSYYGAGLLRSADGGNTWCLIPGTSDVAAGLALVEHGFLGEGFAGFAWSTPPSPPVVVAAVSQASEGELVDADLGGYSYAGLYYSNDSGTTWHLATITDGNGNDVQGPKDTWAGVDGNAATAVVWNPVRNLFVAAVRFHGYYQSPDGVTWTRMTAQPGTGLTTKNCPTAISLTGSTTCPIFRGALAVNPETGDTFAWTVALDNEDQALWLDQGLWQDVCNPTSGACANQSIAFSKQWSTALLDTSTSQGAILANGNYNLALAAVPSGQDTLLLAGANDLWKCSLAAGCQWRNTTNSTTCMSAQVGEYQHAIEWDPANPLEIFVGNDSGLWRSQDAIGETGSACSSSDASHWQNLNGSLGSLAEVESLAGVALTPYTMMAGLGANGTAGIKGASDPVLQWPEILPGYGGPVVIDPTNSDKWYANNGAGVSIHLCAQTGTCTAADFGSEPTVTDTDTGDDGLTMIEPAPFLVDPVDASQLLIATCRLWRGPASGKGWTAGNAITPILGGGADCGSSPQIRSLAAAALSGGGEVVYAGTYGTANGGGNMGGHVLSAVMDSNGTWSGWQDLTQNPVGNDTLAFNAYNLDVASLTIDPHDSTGQTVYVTIAGVPNPQLSIRSLYRSTDGGAHWARVMSNLVDAPVNALVVDPVDTNTVYVATDAGVFATQQMATCGDAYANCWASYGSGLPDAPVTALLATQPSASLNVLVAGTYGRGIWQIPLLTAGQQMTSASVNPTSLSFGSQGENTTSAAQTITLTNNGGIALVPTSITANGDFSRTVSCIGATINTGQSCAIQVTFSPTALGARTGQLVIEGNIASGNIVVGLSGTGTPPPAVTLSPQSIDFGNVESETTAAALQITVANSGGVAAAISSVTVTGPFLLAGNACGASVAADSDCELTVQFSPTSNGPASGKLTMVDDAGTQTVQLSGNGTAPPTDTLSIGSLSFAGTIVGVSSPSQPVTLTNRGGNPLTSIAISTSGPFQQSNNCTTQLIGPASCTIGVVFLPTAAGPATGQLIVSDILRATPQTISLQGTGVNPPAFTVTPPSVTFLGIQPGATSSPQTLTVTNSGGAAMTNIGLQISGPGAAAFATGADMCGDELAPAASCTVQVTFTAPPSVTANASLILSTSTHGPRNSAITATVPLNGNGVSSGALEAAPGQVNFPTTGVGQTSSPVAVTLTNLNTAASFNSLAVTLSAPFQVSSGNCGVSLAAGVSCTVNVVFAPASTGPQAGTLTITSPGLSAPVVVPLTGVGFDFTPGVSGSASQTVSSGETATYALTLQPGGASASFSFKCSSPPEYASCNFNPAPLEVAANATGTETVQIATGQSSAGLERPGWNGIAPLSLACGALLLWPLSRRRARGWILLILLAVMFAVGGAGCSGSGGGTGGAAGGSGTNTPPGTYSVKVTASSGGVQHAVTLTLVVD